MKKLIHFLLPILVFSLLYNCSKDDDTTTAIQQPPKKDIKKTLDDVIPVDVLTNMRELGANIYEGDNPPILQGTYIVDPLVLTSSNIEKDHVGKLFIGKEITFSNQIEDSITIQVNSLKGDISGGGLGGYIIGDHCQFSAFIETIITDKESNTKAKTSYLLSGTVANNGIEDFQLSNFMIDDFGDPAEIWLEIGQGRVTKDKDEFSQIIDGDSEWYSKLPDCPCEYSEDYNLKEELCGTWVDFTSGCLGISHLSDFHYGAKYELRWAKSKDKSGQQCTYDANKKLITGGIGAGSPDKFGIPGTCVYNGKHMEADVEPWKKIACSSYLNNWKANEGVGCSKNVVSGIEHLKTMVGEMTCEAITSIFKTIDGSKNVTSEFKDYIKGNNPNYNLDNLKSDLNTVFQEFNCNDSTEINCKSLQEAINNL